MAAIQDRGVYVFTKHFALNDQEEGRYGISTWSNEQAIRELYLEGFEGSVAKGGGMGVMSSFNRLGVIWAGAHRGLMTGILRDEWGMKGAAITDCSMFALYMDYRMGLLAGQDIWDGLSILNGRSVDTSFGMSLETGLIHANRVGDMDPTMIHFLKEEGLSEQEILEGCQKKGGLLGISGVSNDLRYIEEAADGGNERAKLAIDVFVTGIVHYIGAFYLDLGRLDDLVFTAGIGEHSARIRQMVCGKLAPIGVKLDGVKNEACSGEGVISAEDSAVRVRVIPTNEELGIARRTYEID